MGSPLWKRGVRGDFVEIVNSIGVQHCFLCEIHKLPLQDLRRFKLTHFPIIVKKKGRLTPSPSEEKGEMRGEF
jgi:hypothetical protein